MGFRFKFDVQFDAQSVTRRAIEREGAHFAEVAETMGQEMVAEVRRIVASEYPTTNHKPNTTHLVESFEHKVVRGGGPGGFPYKIILRTKSGASAGKVAALNWGVGQKAGTYRIVPRNVPRALEFKNPNRSDIYVSKRSGKTSGRSGQYAGRVLRPYADHPISGPKRGGKFMERARDIVIRRHGYTPG